MREFFRAIPGWILLILALTLCAFLCFLMGLAQVSWDVTQDRRHSLTDGSRTLLANLERPVIVRYYVSRNDNALPIDFRNYAEYIDSFLDSVVEASSGKVQLETLDPQPNSDAEQSAFLDGIEAHAISADTDVFMGISFSSSRGKAVLPFLNPNDQNSLEYEILRNIQKVARTERVKLGVISSLPINREGQPWFLSKQLSEAYELINIGKKEAIPEEIDSLLIVFPSNVSSAFNEKIDDFTARGGSLVILMDSLCLTMDFLGLAQSVDDFHGQWEGLDRATGLQFTSRRSIMDMIFRSELDRGQGVESLSYFLTVNELGIHSQHEVTKGLNHLNLPIAGSFLGRAHEELKFTPLLVSTDQARLEESQTLLTANKTENDRLNSTFRSDEKVYPISVVLEGKLRSFVTGKERPEVQPSRMILIGDADLIANPYTGTTKTVQDQEQFFPINNNLSLIINSIGFLQNDTLLNTARARTTQARPLTRLAELEREIQKKYQDRMVTLEQKLERQQASEVYQKFDDQVGGSTTMRDPNFRGQLAEQKRERKKVEGQLRVLKRDLREEIHALKSRIKWINILSVPLAILALAIVVLLRRHQISRAN